MLGRSNGCRDDLHAKLSAVALLWIVSRISYIPHMISIRPNQNLTMDALCGIELRDARKATTFSKALIRRFILQGLKDIHVLTCRSARYRLYLTPRGNFVSRNVLDVATPLRVIQISHVCITVGMPCILQTCLDSIIDLILPSTDYSTTLITPSIRHVMQA